MRKAQKRQAEDFLELLGQVHQEIKLAIAEKNIAVAQELLGQCQQGAIELGGLIEKTEGEGFVTVSYLEKYCEIVYGMYAEISAESVVNAEKVYKHLRKALLVVENSVRNDIPVRKEVVFFPYKASMWDSLESVYLAAKEDPECDAYCVPIPYYDRNPDGSFGKMHYEGAEYPQNIEVVDWQTYRLEERRPDVIYIHNPYDEYNYVTSVHPRFYSSNLKKYTDELVYIPYFVLPEVDPQDEKTVEKMRHFCLQPGVLNADKVILQSAAMSRIYMNEYIKAAQANGVSVDREQLQKKYLGLGSPKFDKVKNTKKEDIEIPKEWQKLIQKADGSWKKVLFYNTSIAALLEHGEQMLEKMRWVFKVFQDNQNEVALLWRPHPLIKATVESMRPQLWEEYELLVNDYRSAGWGIYDDTAELNRAIALCDAYYGDPSSVVQLCQEAGMPVMIQDVKIRSYCYSWEDNLFARGMAVDDELIWMPLSMAGFLAGIDKKTGKIKCQCLLSEKDKAWEHYLYTDVAQTEDLLYLAPTKAKTIAVYHKKSAKLSEIEINIPYRHAVQVGSYAYTVQDKNYIFFVGACNTNVIVRLDTLTNKIDFFGSKFYNIKKVIYGKKAAFVDHKLFIPLKEGGSLYILDIESENESVICIDPKKRMLNTIDYSNKKFYVTTDCGQLLKFDYQKNETEELVLPNQKMYYASYCTDESLWLFPLDITEYGIKMNLDDDSFTVFSVPKVVYNVVEKEGQLWLNVRGCLLKLNAQNQIRTMPYYMGNAEEHVEFLKQWYGKNFLKNNMSEGSLVYFALPTFLESIIT